MSRIARWNLEKTKVKVVFRLQFHATHVPHAGWDKLFISFIPADSGKVTAKTTKANVRNGTCKWADPIYETTRLLQDTKTKEYDEKLYKLVVAMGTSRSGILGEVTINLAEYADALKPSVVQLPLHGCDSGAILHVTVQLLTSKTGFREFEQQRELREKGLATDQNSPDESSRIKASSSEETLNNHLDKINSGVRFKDKSQEKNEEAMRQNEEYTDLAAGFDASSNTSESLYAEKHGTSSTNEIDSLKSVKSGDLAGLGQSPQKEKGTSDWVHGWSSDYMADSNDLASAMEENVRLKGCLEMAESSIDELKLEVSVLQRHSDEIGSEAQKLSQLLVSEIASGEQLVNEVSLLKSECSKLKEDVEHLHTFKSCASFADKDRGNLCHDIQLRWLKGLSVVENKIRDLQNKACYGYHERDVRFFLPDLEALLVVLQDLKKGVSKPETANIIENKELGGHKSEHFVSDTVLDTDIYQPELGPLHYLSIPGFVSREPNSADSANAMKEKIFELLRELDESKVERESLTKKMDQMECYYEGLVQELEENQRQLLGELQSLRTEHSTCLYTISSSKAEMESLRQEMNEQILRFAEEKQSLHSLNKELERRAAAAEAALKRARLNYSIAVNHLQKDLELLSSQVVSMFETNENLIKQAFPDPSQDNFQEQPRTIQNQKTDNQGFHVKKFLQVQDQKAVAKEQSAGGGDILLEDLKRSLNVQQGLYQKVEDELYEMHSMNMYLDVFSKILQETLVEASDRIRIMKERIDELTWQLDLSTEAKELLKQRLDIALDEVCALNENKAACIAKCNDVALKNQKLEANLQNISHENVLLMQNIAEMESLLLEYKSYESKYNACFTEKMELTNLLEKETQEKGNLETSVSHLQVELGSLQRKFHNLVIENENLQNVVDSLRNKLQNFYKGKFNGLSLGDEGEDLDFGSHDVALQLERFLQKVYDKLLLLLTKNKDLKKERDDAQVSLSRAESGMMQMKQKFESDIQNMVDRLETSSTLVQRLQLEVEAIAERLEQSSQGELKYKMNHKEFLSHLDHFEAEAQQLVTKTEDLNKEILTLGDLADELRRSKLTIAELTEEKHVLMASLEDKSQESSKRAVDLESSRRNFEDELQVERSLREKLEATVEILTSELNKKHLQLLDFEEQKSQLIHLKQTVCGLQSENLTQGQIISRHEELLRNSQQESMCTSELKSQLSEMFEFAIAADVQLVFTRTQWEFYVQELRKKHLEVETALSQCLANGAQHMDENTRLLTNLEALRSELKVERSLRDQLENKLDDLTSQLDEKHVQLQNFEEQQSQLVYLKQMVSNLEVEKSSQSQLLSEYEESLTNSHQESLIITDLTSELFEILGFSIALDVQLVFMRAHYEVCVDELQKEHIHVQTAISHCLANEAKYMQENAGLLTGLDDLKSKLEASIAENRVLMDTNNSMKAKIEECRSRATKVERSYSDNRSRYACELEQLKDLMSSYEKQMESLLVLKTEFEIEAEVLKAKVAKEQGHSDELVVLQRQCNQLNQRLSEQILKAEEFKNLSIHLKELKDKAEAECAQAREKSEYREPLSPQQESLRIIFIKEQYEAKVQELRQQLSISKKHSEEMLMKFQDAVDEIETRRRAEASHLKRNEELGGKILELEAELQAVISDKREKMMAYDMMKAELDCSLISLECCKEEKQKLEASLEECNQEKLKISHELDMMKELVESFRSCADSQKEGNVRSKREADMHLDCDDSVNSDEKESSCSVPIDETDNSRPKSQQDTILPRSINGHGNQSPCDEETVANSDKEHLALINDNFRAQALRSSLDHLNNELERMKNDNLLLPEDDNDLDAKFPGLERELMQLRKANEELRSIFPVFDEHSVCGNALERVLALEIELAEALRAKKKSTIQFQSSFLKQHSDDEAIFQSFRDINDLIEEMLEMKGRYSSMESELREMHDRYSQLSLKFAEVEGERQKLMMTLKNVRASKKALLLNRPSSASLGEHP